MFPAQKCEPERMADSALEPVPHRLCGNRPGVLPNDRPPWNLSISLFCSTIRQLSGARGSGKARARAVYYYEKGPGNPVYELNDSFRSETGTHGGMSRRDQCPVVWLDVDCPGVARIHAYVLFPTDYTPCYGVPTMVLRRSTEYCLVQL